MFAKTSRYYDLGNLVYRDASGKERVYKERRLIPHDIPIESTTTMRQSERLDLVADRILGDPQLFWKLCDANRVMNPIESWSTSGQTLMVPEA